jgi:hypothetical protein
MNNPIKVGPFGVLVISVCNHGEHYETPCIIVQGYVMLLQSVWSRNLNNDAA